MGHLSFVCDAVRGIGRPWHRYDGVRGLRLVGFAERPKQ